MAFLGRVVEAAAAVVVTGVAPSAARAQDVVEAPAVVRMDLPAVARVLSLRAVRESSTDATQRVRVLVQTVANDVHDVLLTAPREGWCVRVDDAVCRPVALSGTPIAPTQAMGRGSFVLTLEGAPAAADVVDVVVRTMIPGRFGEARARIAPVSESRRGAVADETERR